jgi:hypothetical protein
MGGVIKGFAAGTIIICQMVLNGVGTIDNVLTMLLLAAGVANPHVQVYIVAILAVMVAVAVIRTVGGFFALAVILFLAVLVLCRADPNITLAPPLPGPASTLNTTL